MSKASKQLKEEIKHKKFLMQKYKTAFDIIKKHVDKLDLMQLLETHAPKDEYDFEIADIVKFAIKTKEEDMLADVIIRVFSQAFGQNFSAQRENVLKASKNILQEFKMLSPTKKESYFIAKDLLPGSCFFEFQQGKYIIGKHLFSKSGKMRLNTSLYLYGDDDGIFEYSAIAPFAYIISASHAESSGKGVYNALEEMGVYNPSVDGSWCEEDSIKKLDLNMLKNTAEELARWAEETYTKYKWISVLGI